MSLAGSSSRKLPARTSSTSVHSAGEALWTDTASGRLLPAATATIFVPLPRRVGPTARPPFSRSRKWHLRTLLPGSACRVHADVRPAGVKLLPACPNGSTAGSADGRSGTVGTSLEARATALPCPAPTAHRAAPPAYHATDGHGCPPAAQAAAQVLPPPTVLRSTPSVLPSFTPEISTEHLQHDSKQAFRCL